LVLLWLSLFALAWGAAFIGLSHGPEIIFSIEGSLMAIAIVAAWAKFGRRYIPGKALLMAPLYVAWKLPLYAAFIVRRQTAWVRTKRDTV
ncbi:MAG: glycosyl transferase, partial [Cyanobacteria bacterium P01_A01_bin.135]